jgi:hypothetical protein
MKIAYLVFGILFTSLASAQSIPTKESARSEEFCSSEWTKRGQLDNSMYQYCLRQELDGYQEFVFLAGKYKAQPWIQNAINYSVKEWTKKGLRQDQMVAYTLKQITEGWEDLQYESKQPNFNKNKAAACTSKWAPQYNMVTYCYKQD